MNPDSFNEADPKRVALLHADLEIEVFVGGTLEKIARRVRAIGFEVSNEDYGAIAAEVADKIQAVLQVKSILRSVRPEDRATVDYWLRTKPVPVIVALLRVLERQYERSGDQLLSALQAEIATFSGVEDQLQRFAAQIRLTAADAVA